MRTVITPRPPNLLGHLNPVVLARTLWSQRSLIARFTRREIEARYRGSWLGVFWSCVNPLVLLLTYTFVFGVVFRARWPHAQASGVGDYAMTLFCGLIPFNVLAECVGRAPGLVVGVPSYIKKVVFPLEILAVSLLGSALFHAVVSLVILIVASVVTGRPPGLTILLLPLVAVPLAFTTLGLTWFLASLGVFVRDIGYLIGLAIQVLLFGTPIFYALETVPDWLRPAMRWNPLTSIVENFRRVVLWGALPDWIDLLAWTLLSGAILLFGYAWFAKTKKAFADVI